jgi:hypothetical protein
MAAMSKYSLDTLSPERRAQICAEDQCHAAIHEAGHFVVAKYLGLSNVQAEIRKIEPQDYTEKEWVGSTRCLMEGVDASKRIMVAVAPRPAGTTRSSTNCTLRWRIFLNRCRNPIGICPAVLPARYPSNSGMRWSRYLSCSIETRASCGTLF